MSADRAADERARLRAAEDDLAAAVVELQAASATRRAGPWGTVACPFKGLASFEVDDADVFFGRERLVAEMVARLAGDFAARASSARRAAASRRCSRPACCPRSRAACCRAAPTGPSPLLRPGEHPRRGARAGDRPSRRRRGPAGGRRRSVRGAVHRLPGRGRARGLRRRAARRGARPAPPRARPDRAARRLLRALRELPRAVADARAPATSRSARCGATSCAARSCCRPSAPASASTMRWSTRSSPMSGRAGGAAAALHRAARAVAGARRSPARVARLRSRGRRARRGGAARRARLRGARARANGRSRGRSSCGSRASARADVAVRRRLPLAELERIPGAAEVLGEARRRPAGDHRRRGGGGRPRGAAARVAAAAGVARGGRGGPAPAPPTRRGGARVGRARARSRRALPRRPAGRRARLGGAQHERELDRVERAFIDESRAAGGRAHRRLRAVLAGVAVLLAVAVVAWLVALEQRGSARDEATAADAQRLGVARAGARTTSTARCCSRAREWRSTKAPRRAGTCWPRLIEEPGGDRGDARRRRALLGARAEPGRPHARRRRSGRQPVPVRHAHATARGRPRRAGGRLADHAARLQPRRPPARGRARRGVGQPGRAGRHAHAPAGAADGALRRPAGGHRHAVRRRATASTWRASRLARRRHRRRPWSASTSAAGTGSAVRSRSVALLRRCCRRATRR